MNLALRTLHERLRGGGDPAMVWARLCAAMHAQGDADPCADPAAVAISIGLRGTATEWRRDLRLLGVIAADGGWVESRAHAVRCALELVGDSFDVVTPAAGWAPVATVPRPLRELLRPPAVRQTAGVLLELIDGATSEVVLATPYVDQPAVSAVAGALATARGRGVDVQVITSPGRGQEFAGLGGGELALGGAVRVTEVRTEISPLGSHAKVLVVDRERAYIGSANLTSAGLERHLEVGVVVYGQQVGELARLLAAMQRLGQPILF